MGAVYLARQADRQVAIKVFLPASPLEQAENEDFQRRLDEIIAQNTLLAHPHILPTLDHGRRSGLVYLLMPCIAGESLEALLKREGALPFAQIQRYLVQLAAALDYAHARGVLHRDIKTGNILLTPDGNALLADFGLAGLTTEKNFARARRALPGMLNAIAPEYVLGKAIDPRADLYSLGAVLYQMVTGTPLFQGGSLSEVAMKHVRAQPPSPRSLRSDLPQAAEQVLMRALAKQPIDRYSQARDLASAFRLALEAASSTGYERGADALARLTDLARRRTTPTRLPVSRSGGLFDPKWQAYASLSTANQAGGDANAVQPPSVPLSPLSFPEAAPAAQQAASTASQAYMGFGEPENAGNRWDQDAQAFSSFQAVDAARSGFAAPSAPAENEIDRFGPLSFVQNTFQPGAAGQSLAPESGAGHALQLAENSVPGTTEGFRFAPEQSESIPTGPLNLFANVPGSGSSENAHAIKLTDPVKIVQVPVADQPGHFKTGFLPVIPVEEASEKPPRRANKKRRAIVSLLLIVILVAAGSGVFWLTRIQNNAPATTVKTPVASPTMSANAQATATANANIILADDLSQNTHNWPVGPQPGGPQSWYTCTFEDGAYHIANNDKNRGAASILPGKVVNAPFAYSLTMEQIKGDETSLNNQFGMILDASVQTVQGKQIDKFYAFEIRNKAGGQYQFWKYDNSKSGNPWKMLWSKGMGKEFLQGSGSSHMNTVKIVASDTMFTFIVNGKQVGTFKDSSFSGGMVGMLVNLNGAEVAFSDFLLTHS